MNFLQDEKPYPDAAPFYESPLSQHTLAAEYQNLTEEFVKKQFVPEVTKETEVACILGYGARFTDTKNFENGPSVVEPLKMLAFTFSDSDSGATLGQLEKFSQNHPGFRITATNFKLTSDGLSSTKSSFYKADTDNQVDVPPVEIEVTVVPLDYLHEIYKKAYAEFLKNESSIEVKDEEGNILNPGSTRDTSAQQILDQQIGGSIKEALGANPRMLTELDAKPDVQKKIDLILEAVGVC